MAESPITDIGPWSEIKIEIIEKYAKAYSQILAKNPSISEHAYIDAFSGAGEHRSRSSGEMVKGSPLVALGVEPRFKRYHFIDIHKERLAYLQNLAQDRTDVTLHEGDCNEILVRDVFPLIQYTKRKRALCLIDPYGLDLDWTVIQSAGASRTIEIFLNFPVMHINRNVLRKDQKAVSESEAQRFTRLWGDESWREVAYDDGSGDLFGYQHRKPHEAYVKAFRERLKKVAGFKFVPEPLAMRNSRNAVVYYLFFASRNSTGGKIVEEIFGKYR